MNGARINTEIKETKIMMDSLLVLAKDKSLSSSERAEYYKDYLSVSSYYLKLNQAKPSHNLSIA